MKCQVRLSYKSVKKEVGCQVRVSSKKCQVRSVLQECQVRVSYKSVK